jgi:hypothetical protein
VLEVACFRASYRRTILQLKEFRQLLHLKELDNRFSVEKRAHLVSYQRRVPHFHIYHSKSVSLWTKLFELLGKCKSLGKHELLIFGFQSSCFVHTVEQCRVCLAQSSK